MKDPFEKLVEIIRGTKIDCKFTIFEIGALKLDDAKSERFYKLLDYFSSTKIIGFEIEKEVCDEMKSKAALGVKYYPHALGEKNEKKTEK